MLHASVGNMKPNKDQNGKYITSEYIDLMLYYIIQDLFSIHQEYSKRFGDLVLCLDNQTEKGYWRRDVYSQYKMNRTNAKDETDVIFPEVFEHTNKLLANITEHLPWKVINTPRTEADDQMLVLAREFNKFEKIMIHSPDKDMIQAQRNTDNVSQYSPLTKKWLVAESKSIDMDNWVQEHVVLGDASDGVPRIIDMTVFTENFINYLKDYGHDIKDPMEFRASSISNEEKIKLLTDYDIYVLNRKGESTGVKDVYYKARFGPSALKKKIKEFGSLDGFLDSHPMYRPNYDRNFILVMEDGIPTDIWNEIIIEYKTAKTDYNIKEFEDYLKENNLKSILMDLPRIFKLNRELTAEDFNW